MSGLRTSCRTGVRQPSITKIGMDNYQDSAHGHEFGGLSRVVMVRKTDQRIFASAKNGEEPKYETVTKETYETFRGNKTESKITSVGKRGVYDKFTKDLNESLSPIKNGSPVRKLESPRGNMSKQAKKQDTPTHSKQVDPTTFANECLIAHNEYRAKHGVPPLKLSKQISATAKKWADTLANRGTLSHSQNKDYGENIFSCWNSNPSYMLTGKEAVDAWYSEIKDHTFGTEPTSLKSGHFTQVMWKGSADLGVAYSKAKDGKYIVVANYFPPGNVIGSFSANVPPVGGFPSGSQSGLNEVDLKFEGECLKAHNEYRKIHGIEPLKLNRRLCKESKEWAKHLASKGQIEHRKHASYGENIYCYWSSNPSHTLTGKEPVESWYNEITCHNFGQEPTDLRSGHFTQVIWKSSRDLGVGVEKNRNGQIFVVASYSPAGNYIGSFRDNVLPIIGSPDADKLLLTNGCEEDFYNQCLKIHNEFRRKHGVPDLKLNFEMCDYAQEWAHHLAKDGKLAHRPDCRYGENLFYMWSSDPSATPTAREVCKRWYDEIQEFTFGVESRTPRAGHFTQMIWKDSSEFGIGLAKGKNNGKSFVVANYNPKGNYVGKYTNNVPKPLK